jgi:hypothetical protein
MLGTAIGAPSARRPDLPPALEQVIVAALARPPEQRRQSAQVMSLATPGRDRDPAAIALCSRRCSPASGPAS